MKINRNTALAVAFLAGITLLCSAQTSPAQAVRQVSRPVVSQSKKSSASTKSTKSSVSKKSNSKKQTSETDPPGRNSEVDGETTSTSSAKVKPASTPVNVRSLTGDQQKRANELGKWLNAISSQREPTPEHKAALRTTLQAASMGSVQPDPRIVEDLALDLCAAMTIGNLTSGDKDRLSEDICLVLNSGAFSKEEVHAVIDKCRSRLQASGVAYADLQKIVSDLQAISFDLQHRTKVLPTPTPAPEATPAPTRHLLPAPSRGVITAPIATPTASQKLPSPRMD
ncbi:hypothetical protein CVU37_00475 [candidate division BRC1 bacterium HGW-BRC1-1]|jgi:hypothetical protein|nr:MAG: hypothetical protein CVU37_00475 [candidate division BRC1 bacterium HGW-BRC1-1]